VLNAAPEEIGFKLPMIAEYKSWMQVLNTTEGQQTNVELISGAETKAPPRSVLAFAGLA
jgi:glycogen operon protein